jgi:purine-nucleoside phosphorylase
MWESFVQNLYETIIEAASYLENQGVVGARVAVVLGSGLGAFADTLQESIIIPYAKIPGFVPTGVQGHQGRLVFGKLASGDTIIAMQGRVHFYEGHSMMQVTFAVRVLARLGIKTILMTNAAGGVNADYHPGELVIIKDHLNLTSNNPLIGPNDERLGKRFPDMTQAYPERLRKIAHDTAKSLGFTLREGIYAALTGPTYETPAEVRMLRGLGADLVGMSTVPEVIVAAHSGVSVLGISCVTNLAAGVSEGPIDHAHIEEVATRTRELFLALVSGILAVIAGEKTS